MHETIAARPGRMQDREVLNGGTSDCEMGIIETPSPYFALVFASTTIVSQAQKTAFSSEHLVDTEEAMTDGTFFDKLTNDVFQATEQIATKLEEGLSVLMTGDLPDVTRSHHVSEPMVMQSEENFESLSEEEIQNLLLQEMMENSPLEGMADSVIGDIMKNQASGPSSLWEHFQAFKSAITWSETFIQCLVAFQVFMFFSSLWVSRKDGSLTTRVVLMVFIGTLVRSAEWLNDLGSKNWQKFSTQNYFDRRGIFFAVMVCGPLLLDCLMMLLLFVKEAGQLLVEVKRGEIRRKNLSKKKKTENSESKKND
eukprot:scaffold2243_cov122-Cylindrotheca_fusiformis.AAC.15